MLQINLSERSFEATKLLQRSKGVFSKTRRTLTSLPKFRITRLSVQDRFHTTALFERCFNKHYRYNTKGTVTPAHNCKLPETDAGYALWPDWKPSPLLLKGTVQCKQLDTTEKRFLPGCNDACPIYRYISDRRPRGISPQQLDVAFHRISVRCTITLLRILNGSVGYRTDSEDSLMSPGHYNRIRKKKCKTVCDEDAVIPDICLERRSISTVMYCKD